MVSKGDYPRWLKDSEGWTADDDWEPDEYLQWFQRLSDAKKNLKNLYVEVDTQAIQLLKELCESFKSELPADVNLSGKVGHLIARFGVAYNFYNRISFEDLPESKAVGRVQKYLPRLRIGMHTKDIARMLQAAADKVPFSKAVEDILTEWTSYVENSIPVLMEWYSEVSMGREVNSYFCHIIQSSAKNGVPKSSELPAIIAEAQKSDGYNAVSKNQFENALKVLNTDERIEQFLSLRLDPGVNTAVGYVRDEVKCFKAVLASGKLKDVLDKIESLEKDNLSWSKTVGPACVAIIRLGKRSAGKDLEKLAEYARKHARRPV